ncbi:MAG TPA: hypothetical protein DIS77_08090 [Rothia sp.]|nr:hypothetical protein [Rothia sp. (in: high G+C Gram-positive bacteria)]
MIAPLLAALADGFAVVLVLALLTAAAAGSTAYLLNPADPFPQPVTCWLQRFLGIPNENQEHEPKAPPRASSVRIQIQDGPIYLDCSLSALLVRQGLPFTPLSHESGSKTPQ